MYKKKERKKKKKYLIFIYKKPGDNICEDPTEKDRKYISVPVGHVWVGGDNLSNSTDSRTYGPVAMGLIKGKVFAKVKKKGL